MYAMLAAMKDHVNYLRNNLKANAMGQGYADFAGASYQPLHLQLLGPLLGPH
jgi:hypothetical protein